MIWIVLAVFFFLVGLSFGSFGSVLVHRIRHKEAGILTGRSKCTSCQHQLVAKDLVPVLSYLFLKGRCRYCKAAVSWMYPTIEVVTGLLFLAVFLFQGAVVDGPLFLSLYIMWCFVVMSVYDILYFEIPDEISLPAIVALLLTTGLASTPVSIGDGLLGVLIIVGFFAAQILVSRGTWMGLGDLRIGAIMGLFLGWQMGLVALICSYIIGSLVSIGLLFAQRKLSLRSEIPFGPFLSAGFMVAFFFGQDMLQWYLGLLAL